MEQHELVAKFQKWIDQKPGLDPYNYSSQSQINTEYKHIADQKRRAQRALNIVSYISHDEDAWREAFRAFSGRLSLNDKGELDYCAGQYWPTEYRLAAAVVLESYIFYSCSGHKDTALKVLNYLRNTSEVSRTDLWAQEWGAHQAQGDLGYDCDVLTVDESVEWDRLVWNQQDKIKDTILRDAVIGLTRYYCQQAKEGLENVSTD